MVLGKVKALWARGLQLVRLFGTGDNYLISTRALRVGVAVDTSEVGARPLHAAWMLRGVALPTRRGAQRGGCGARRGEPAPGDPAPGPRRAGAPAAGRGRRGGG